MQRPEARVGLVYQGTAEKAKVAGEYWKMGESSQGQARGIVNGQILESLVDGGNI